MILIPAIDIKDGKCVRLRQGKMDDTTVFSDNPIEMADRWAASGAKRLHIVDLDGAVHGKPKNAELVHEIAEQYPDIPIQLGGGVRDEDTVEAYLNAGVQYVIIGTRAVNEPHFVSDIALGYPRHIIVGLDAIDGKLAVDGWSKLSKHDLIDLAQYFENDGVHAIIYTDISKDGMMQGANIELTKKLAESVRIPVIASGGVTNLEDLKKLKAIEKSGVSGVITGRAIYEGTLDFAEGQCLLLAK
ncbi:MAG: 1-(5-phosphoribosyl)-5-[(5-phosphoribosylamino)methylideneamino]imidazole-4-carboxamide isomerase [Arenicellaceae bacterium]|nr:1-(5-phosphoribosyl)-5-[(5-phosphoribosylamino)methylideneamino]imidazole-4-carboxamide isomerase [Arenicellaceae bacterium]